MLIAPKTTTNILPTKTFSNSLVFFLSFDQTSMENIVDALLNIEVKDAIKEAIITLNINPVKPLKNNLKNLLTLI